MLSSMLANSWGMLSEAQRAALAVWLNAYGALLFALGSGEQLAVLTADTEARQLAAWIDGAERLRAVVNGPTPEQLYGDRSGAPQWGVVLAAWEHREPAIAAALRDLRDGYTEVANAGGPAAGFVSDGAMRQWAWDRAGREASTGPGMPSQPRRRRGAGMEVFFVLVLGWLVFGGRR